MQVVMIEIGADDHLSIVIAKENQRTSGIPSGTIR